MVIRANPNDEGDIRPIVRTAKVGNHSLWLGGGALLFGGLLLFNALNQKRLATAVPETRHISAGTGFLSAPPPLVLPPHLLDQPVYEWKVERPRLFRAEPISVSSTAPAPPPRRARIADREITQAPSYSYTPAPSYSPPVIIPTQINTPTPGEDRAPTSPDRVAARRLIKPELTVPQGTIIAGVLETALDSTRPGAVRAIVSRDVKSFDGSRVLIPRGSRLYGEYSAEVNPGQRRALINWQRLTRPDAVIIDLNSPAADPLGRNGVEGKVNSHFFARFGAAILQSVLDLGVGLATRSVSNDTVIVAVPGSTQQVTQQQTAQQVQPTLKVQQGTSISVFVARDLDFSTVDY